MPNRPCPIDVAIIGGGIIGCAVLYELSKYNLSIALLESENDVACGTTRANSAIVHAGYDPEPGTWMAKTNVRGAELTRTLCKKLDVPYRRSGALVLGFDEADMSMLHMLYERGQQNRVPELSLLDANAARALEPQLSQDVIGALLAPSAGIVSPWELALALAQTAVRNGASVLTNHRVEAIENTGDSYNILTSSGTVYARYIINAAGLYADHIHTMAGGSGFTIRPVRGQYYLLDKAQGGIVKRVIFQCPGKHGKGVLVAPTIHGNLIVGPDSEYIDSREDVSTATQRLSFVAETATKSIPCLSLRENIRNFAGLRAYTEHDDFIIEPSAQAARFINLAGIKSPGLTSAPAIAEHMPAMLSKIGLEMREKGEFYDRREITRIRHVSNAEKVRLIAQNPLYGRVICRCEGITEGEIVDCLHDVLPPVSLDGVKRRCNTGLGRCQGGFCGPRVHEIISREQNRPMTDITQDLEGSYIVTGKTKEVAR